MEAKGLHYLALCLRHPGVEFQKAWTSPQMAWTKGHSGRINVGPPRGTDERGIAGTHGDLGDAGRS